MSKKIFHIFEAFLDFLLYALSLKPFVKFLRRYKTASLFLLGLIFLSLAVYFSTWNQEDFFMLKNNILSLSETHKLFSYLVFFSFYLVFAVLGLPGTVFLSAVGGFIFGFFEAFLVSLFAVMTGSLASFLAARFLLRDFFIKSLKKRKKALRLNKIYDRLKENEVYYLFMFRLFPFAPLAITNIVMGLGRMKFKVFSMVCFLTIIPYLLIYVGVGSQLSQMKSWNDLYEPDLLLSFSLLAILPLFIKYLFRYLKRIRKKKFNLEDSDLSAEEAAISQN